MNKTKKKRKILNSKRKKINNRNLIKKTKKNKIKLGGANNLIEPNENSIILLMENILLDFRDKAALKKTMIKKYCLLPYKQDYESREIAGDTDSTIETLKDIYKDLFTYHKNNDKVKKYFSDLNVNLSLIDPRANKGSAVSEKIELAISKYSNCFNVNHFSYQKYENTGESKRDKCIEDFNACLYLSNTLKPGDAVIADHGSAAKGNKILQYYPIGDKIKKSLNSAYDRFETYQKKEDGNWKKCSGADDNVDLYPKNKYIWDRVGIIMCIKLPGEKDNNMEVNNESMVDSTIDGDYLCICVKGISKTTDNMNFRGSEVIVLIKKYRKGVEIVTNEEGQESAPDGQDSNPLYFSDEILSNKKGENEGGENEGGENEGGENEGGNYFGIITPEIKAIAENKYIDRSISLDQIKNPSGYTFKSFSDNNKTIFSFCFKYLGDYTFRALEICSFVTQSAINEKKENDFNDKEIFGQYLLPSPEENSKKDYNEEQIVSFFTHDSGNLIVGNKLEKGGFSFENGEVIDKGWEETMIKVQTTIKLFTPKKDILSKAKELYSMINGLNISKLNSNETTLLKLDKNFINTILMTKSNIITNFNSPNYKFYIPKGAEFFIVKMIQLNNPSDINLDGIENSILIEIINQFNLKLGKNFPHTKSNDKNLWSLLNFIDKDKLIESVETLRAQVTPTYFEKIKKGLITTNYEIAIEFLNENCKVSRTTINLSALNKFQKTLIHDKGAYESLDIEIINVYETIKDILCIKNDDIKNDDRENDPITLQQFETIYKIANEDLNEAAKKSARTDLLHILGDDTNFIIDKKNMINKIELYLKSNFVDKANAKYIKIILKWYQDKIGEDIENFKTIKVKNGREDFYTISPIITNSSNYIYQRQMNIYQANIIDLENIIASIDKCKNKITNEFNLYPGVKNFLAALHSISLSRQRRSFISDKEIYIDKNYEIIDEFIYIFEKLNNYKNITIDNKTYQFTIFNNPSMKKIFSNLIKFGNLKLSSNYSTEPLNLETMETDYSDPKNMGSYIIIQSLFSQIKHFIHDNIATQSESKNKMEFINNIFLVNDIRDIIVEIFNELNQIIAGLIDLIKSNGEKIIEILNTPTDTCLINIYEHIKTIFNSDPKGYIPTICRFFNTNEQGNLVTNEHGNLVGKDNISQQFTQTTQDMFSQSRFADSEAASEEIETVEKEEINEIFNNGSLIPLYEDFPLPTYWFHKGMSLEENENDKWWTDKDKNDFRKLFPQDVAVQIESQEYIIKQKAKNVIKLYYKIISNDEDIIEFLSSIIKDDFKILNENKEMVEMTTNEILSLLRKYFYVATNDIPHGDQKKYNPLKQGGLGKYYSALKYLGWGDFEYKKFGNNDEDLREWFVYKYKNIPQGSEGREGREGFLNITYELKLANILNNENKITKELFDNIFKEGYFVKNNNKIDEEECIWKIKKTSLNITDFSEYSLILEKFAIKEQGSAEYSWLDEQVVKEIKEIVVATQNNSPDSEPIMLIPFSLLPYLNQPWRIIADSVVESINFVDFTNKIKYLKNPEFKLNNASTELDISGEALSIRLRQFNNNSDNQKMEPMQEEEEPSYGLDSSPAKIPPAGASTSPGKNVKRQSKYNSPAKISGSKGGPGKNVKRQSKYNSPAKISGSKGGPGSGKGGKARTGIIRGKGGPDSSTGNTLTPAKRPAPPAAEEEAEEEVEEEVEEEAEEEAENDARDMNYFD